MGLERKNGWVHIDGVQVEYPWKVDGFEDELMEV